MASYRRNYERYLIEDSAVISTEGKESEPMMLRDLSARGVGVICNFPFKINQNVLIKFEVPYLLPKSISKQAKVAWCRKINDNLWRSGLDFGLINKPASSFSF